MIELFKEDVKIGDKVKLILTTGKEPIGEVIEIGSNHILIKKEDGVTTRIFEVLLGGWDLIKDNVEIISETLPEDLTKEVEETNEQDDIQTEYIEESEEDSSNEDNLSTDLDVKTDDIKKELQSEDIEEIRNQVTEDVDSFAENKISIKVLGKIQLDRIDTKKNRFPSGRTYRLRQVAKNFNLSISSIVDILKEEDIVINGNPNYKIDQVAYDIIENNKDQIKENEPINDTAKQIQKTENLGLKLHSFSELNQLKDKIDINVGKQLLPGNAKIKRYFPQRQYGFLTDNDGLDYYFNYADIEDDSLLKKLQNFGADGTQIICKLNNYGGKLKAKKLHLPQAVEYFQQKAEDFFNDADYNYAFELTDLILNHFPDYNQSIELRNKLIDKTKRNRKRRVKYQDTSSYLLAKIEIKKGNTDFAKKLYLQAIDLDNQKSENALKELAYLLSGEGRYDEAIELVKEHAKKIKFSNPNSFIAYFYEAKKDYTNAIAYLKEIKPKSKIEKLKLTKRFSICYFGIGDYYYAEKKINEILKIQPNDVVTNKLKQALDIALAKGSEEEIDSIFKEAEISSLTGGLSKFMYYKLENCEYIGVPASEVTKGSFNNKTLEILKDYINTIKDGRPRERAEAYLSQAKIEQIIDSENSKVINTSLARYCTSIAASWAKDGRDTDTLRFFILEAATIDPFYNVLKRYLPMYLQSYYKPSTELRSNIRANWDSILEEFLSINENESFWYGTLDLLLVNSKFSTQFLTSLYNKASYRNISLKFLLPYVNEKIEEKVNKDIFLQLWKQGREKLKREKNMFSANLLALKQSKSTEAIIESFYNIKKILPEWINQLDKQRINTLNDIVETIIELNKQEAFEDKERYFNISVSQLLQLKDEIQDSPTEISFNIVIPIVDFINNLLENEFKEVIETSKPIIEIQIYGEGSIDNTTGLVDVQFSISNKKGSAPISYFELNVANDGGIEFIKENNIINQSLKGGDEKVLKLKLKIKSKLIEQGATNLKLECVYKIRGNEDLINLNDELTLRFYSVSDFKKIKNPFATTADSGPVEDSSMFFGRNDFISNISESIINSKSKCVIIYGQKRSGKSSVLHHLRERLNNTPNAFCISFSLGEIIEDLSPKTFYYTILTEIEDSLAILSEQNENIPSYKAPEYSELNDVPTIIFNDQIKLLKREFNKFPEWSKKKLVLLIDEFTYIYYAIQKKYLSEQFMKTWKSFLEKGFFTSVLIGQDIMPKFKAAFPNEFGVTEDKRLSYLKETDAIELIEKPIWDEEKNRSRFLGKATELILDYTSSNPYYVQIFCARLVDYMNENNAISVTVADVDKIAESFIEGGQALNADKFDNLITAGDADLDAFDANDVLTALKAIAIASKNLDSCSREAIKLGEIDYEEKILKDLKDREVLSTPQPGYYKINVRLFKEWLLIN